MELRFEHVLYVEFQSSDYFFNLKLLQYALFLGSLNCTFQFPKSRLKHIVLLQGFPLFCYRLSNQTNEIVQLGHELLSLPSLLARNGFIHIQELVPLKYELQNTQLRSPICYSGKFSMYKNGRILICKYSNFDERRWIVGTSIQAWLASTIIKRNPESYSNSVLQLRKPDKITENW